MLSRILADPSLDVILSRIDHDLADKARSAGCPCGGVLHSARYPRKPRCGKDLGADWRWRLSFCCAAEGCRSRVTPASVRFLGRRKFIVYLFSGSAGFHVYAAGTTGPTHPYTLGLYSPMLKHLLIWNLPDRDAMMRTVRHEGFHQYLDRITQEAPRWFNEGLGSGQGTGDQALQGGHGPDLWQVGLE